MISIRTANKNDLGVLQNLNQEVFEDNYQYDSDLKMDWTKSEDGKNYFNKILNDPESCCFIAEENGKPIGYIIAIPKKITYLKTKYIEVDNMGVTPAYRSKGVGSLLMEKCIVWAKTKNYKVMYVNSYFRNTKAVAFYKRNDFIEIDIGLYRDL